MKNKNKIWKNNLKKIKRILSALILTFIISWLISFLAPKTYAEWYLPNWDSMLWETAQDLETLDWTDWVDKINNLLLKTLIPLTKYLFVSISILFIVFALFWLVASGWEEDKISEFKKKMWYVIFWFIVIGLSEKIAGVFDPLSWNNSSEFYNVDGLRTIFISVWSFIKIIAWWFAVLMIVVSWFSMITSEWDETKTEEWKKWIIYSFVWLMVILTAEKFILDIFFKDYWQNWPNNTAPQEFSSEIIWIISWILQYLSIFWVAIIITAWIFYIFSMWDDDASTKAWTIIKNVWLWLIIIMISYTIISTFIPN